MRIRFSFGIIVAMFMSMTMLSAEAVAKRVEVIISKVGQKMTVRVDGHTEYVWPVSTGAAGYETPSGTYRPFRMEAEHFSKEWDDAPMPHSIFFTDRGHAIHGSFHVKSLGRRASHGCVRLHPDNAAKLFALVGEAGMSNTSVTLKGGFFDFGGGGRSFSEVGRDIERTVKNKKPASPFLSLFGKPKAKAKPPLKVAAKDAKKVDGKPKKVAAVQVKKTPAKPKKVVAKCQLKPGEKQCPKPPAVKAASNG